MTCIVQGIETMRTLTQLDISATKVTDLAPLSALIGTTVFLGDGYKLDTCPILYGRCEMDSGNLGGGVFGSDADSSLVSKWSAGLEAALEKY